MSLLVLILAGLVVALFATVNDGHPSTTTPAANFTAAELEALQVTTALTTTVVATLAQVNVNDYAAAIWEVTFTADDGTTVVRTVRAWHNGTAAADATTAECAITGAGWSDEITDLDVDLDGAGADQVMRLRGAMTFASGTRKASTIRIPNKPPQAA